MGIDASINYNDKLYEMIQPDSVDVVIDIELKCNQVKSLEDPLYTRYTRDTDTK